MTQQTVYQTVGQLREWLNSEGYCESYISHYNSTTNQLLKFMESNEVSEFNTAVGLDFLLKQYRFIPKSNSRGANAARLRTMQMLSEFQLHGVPLPRTRARAYTIPVGFHQATERFLARRRFEGILEKNMCTFSLYLERFFSYLTGQGVTEIPEITIPHIHGFLRFLIGFTNSTKDHTMRAVRQFMSFCYENSYHPADISVDVPRVHYEKLARIPSAYSYDDVMKLLSLVDRANPVGKRDYAVLMLLTRLGIRCGDICELRFENIDWEKNLISFTQHKTEKHITLPLFDDVGMAIVDYLRFGRPKSDSANIFIRHRAPFIPLISKSFYEMVSGYIGRAGLREQGKKRGPHALRHSLASRLLEENVPLPVISEILGHANTNTTAVYLSISIDKLRNCALEVQ
jgi:site-specific recombinase XerD